MNTETHHNAHQSETTSEDYFFQRAHDVDHGSARSNAAPIPFEAPIRGDQIAELERGLHGLRGILTLLHAEADNRSALDDGHIHARPGLGGRLEDSLFHAADFICWKLYHETFAIADSFDQRAGGAA